MVTPTLCLGGSRLAVQRCYAAVISSAANAKSAACHNSSFQFGHYLVSCRYSSTAKDIFVASKDSLVVSLILL